MLFVQLTSLGIEYFLTGKQAPMIETLWHSFYDNNMLLRRDGYSPNRPRISAWELKLDMRVHTQLGTSCTLDLQLVHILVLSGCHRLCVCVLHGCHLAKIPWWICAGQGLRRIGRENVSRARGREKGKQECGSRPRGWGITFLLSCCWHDQCMLVVVQCLQKGCSQCMCSIFIRFKLLN